MNNKFTVLIIEDEHNICSFMSTILTANNYNVLKASDGQSGYMMITSHCPDLVLLDLGLPDIDGIELIKKVRVYSQVPIIVVSARTHEREKVTALDVGADDYVTKPFGTSELLARVRTALRHTRNRDADENVAQSGKYVCAELTIDFDKRRITVGENEIHLTQNEYKLVALLAKYSGRVLTYDFLIKNIWGMSVKNDNQILRVNMANIRRKIEANPAEPKFLFTEMGVGYRLAEAE